MTFNWTDLSYLVPELAIAIGAVLVLALDLVTKREQKRLLGWASLVVVLVAFAALASLYQSRLAPEGLAPHRLFVGTLVRDFYSVLFDVVFLLAGLLGILLSMRYVEREDLAHGEYYALTLFAILGMMLMAMADELFTFFISYEILSLSVYVLSGIARAQARSAEASVKYFLLGAFSSGFLVYGIALIYGATRTTQLDAVAQYVHLYGTTGSVLLLIGLSLLLIGFGFKVALVPFHAWVPDVYEGAPLPVTAFMAAGVKAAAFAALLRVLFSAFGPLDAVWVPALSVLAVLTMVLGNTAAILQTNIKRMLAYSSIAHAGYMLVGIAAYASRGLAVGSVIFYALVYTVMTVGAFAVALAVGQETEANQLLTDYRGLSTRQPWLAGAMGLFMLSLSGLPLTAGFLGKFYLLNAAINSHLIGLAIVLVITSVVSWYYYLRVAWYMYFDRAEGEKAAASREWPLGFAVGLAGVLVLVLGILPTVALYVTQSAAALFTLGG